MPHRPGVNKKDFVNHFKVVKPKAMASKYRGCKHKLPTSWSKILGKKKWPTLNEEWTNKAAAALAWLHEYRRRRRAGNLVSLGAARFTRLVPALQVVQCGDRFWLSLGHHTWAFLGWRAVTQMTTPYQGPGVRQIVLSFFIDCCGLVRFPNCLIWFLILWLLRLASFDCGGY